MRLLRFTMLQLLLSATLVALLLGLFTSAWRDRKVQTVIHSCFSPNGEYLAALYSSGAVRVWRIEKAHTRLIARAFGDAPFVQADLQSLHFLDNRRLLKLESLEPGYSDPRVTARTLDLGSGATSELMVLNVPYVEQSKVAARGSQLFVAEWPGGGQTIHCYDLDKRRLERRLKVGSDEVCALALSADGTTLAANDFAEDLHVIDLPSGQKLCSFPHTLISVLAISADGSHLATIDRGNRAHTLLPKAVLLDVQKPDSPEEIPELGESYMGLMQFSHDGSRLIAMGFDIGCFDVSTKALRRRISYDELVTAHRDWPSDFPNPIARQSAVSPDGKMLVTSKEARLVFWDLEAEKVWQVLRGNSRLIPMITFICGFAVWAAAWGIIGKRSRQSLAINENQTIGDSGRESLSPRSVPLALKLCRCLIMVGGLVALSIPIVLMFAYGPWLFPTLYFSLFVGLTAITLGASPDYLNFKRTAVLQLVNILALDPVNVVLAALEFALLRSRSVKDYLQTEKR